MVTIRDVPSTSLLGKLQEIDLGTLSVLHTKILTRDRLHKTPNEEIYFELGNLNDFISYGSKDKKEMSK